MGQLATLDAGHPPILTHVSCLQLSVADKADSRNQYHNNPIVELTRNSPIEIRRIGVGVVLVENGENGLNHEINKTDIILV